MSKEQSLKILVIGDPGTGKTSIIRRYVQNIFTPHYKTTVGVDFQLKQLTIGEKDVRVQLWDIAGQERFGQIARVYYKNSHGAILVYDVSRPKTFETVAKWKEEIDRRVLLSNGKPLPVLLVGNKCDLDDAQPDHAQLDKYCASNGFIGWFDTSAKLNLNIDKAIAFLTEKILEHEDLFNVIQVENAINFTPHVKKDVASPWSTCC